MKDATFIDARFKVLVRIHFIIEMIRWTGLAPWEFEFPFPSSRMSTFFLHPKASSRTQEAQIRQDQGGALLRDHTYQSPPERERERERERARERETLTLIPER